MSLENAERFLNEIKHDNALLSEVNSVFGSRDYQKKYLRLVEHCPHDLGDIVRVSKQIRMNFQNNNLTLKDTFHIIQKSTPLAFFRAPYYSRIASCAGLFPDAITDSLGFECRLNDNSRVDFGFCCSNKNSVTEFLAKHTVLPEHHQRLLGGKQWQKMRDFLRGWYASRPLRENIVNMHLEYDTHQPDCMYRVPSLFFRPRDLNRSIADLTWITERALPTLQGGPLSQRQKEVFQRCIENLPTGAKVSQIGLMLSRKSRALRLCIRGVAGEHFQEYLQRIGYTGIASQAQAVLEKLSSVGGKIDLQIDFTDKVHGRLAFECGYSEQYVEYDWFIFLERLEKLGLCTSEKKLLLMQWAGVFLNTMSANLLPVIFVKFINHIKVQYIPGKPLAAKAYPWVNYS